MSDPGGLQSLGLVEVLDWTSAALDRVDRTAFFSRFDEGEAVPYFYEPFLEAFDPDLRKQLGVWYTPTEVVRYMVARVDKALKDDLGIPAGLAGEKRLCAWTRAAERGRTWRKCSAESPKISGSRASGARGRGGQEGGNRAGVRVRDHACAVRGGALAGRPHHAGFGRAAGGGRVGARRSVPYQRADPAGSRRRINRSLSWRSRKSAI